MHFPFSLLFLVHDRATRIIAAQAQRVAQWSYAGAAEDTRRSLVNWPSSIKFFSARMAGLRSSPAIIEAGIESREEDFQLMAIARVCAANPLGFSSPRRAPHPSPFRSAEAITMRERSRRASSSAPPHRDSSAPDLSAPALSPRHSASAVPLRSIGPAPSSSPRSFPSRLPFDLSSPQDPYALSTSSDDPPDSPRINAHQPPNLQPSPNPIEIPSSSTTASHPLPRAPPDSETASTFPLTDSPLLFGPSDFIPALAEDPPRANHLLNLSQFTQRNEPMLSFEAGEPAEERRYFALAELLETERTYFQSLKVLVKVSLAYPHHTILSY